MNKNIAPGKDASAYVVLSVRQLRKMLAVAKLAASMRAQGPAKGKDLANHCTVFQTRVSQLGDDRDLQISGSDVEQDARRQLALLKRVQKVNGL